MQKTFCFTKNWEYSFRFPSGRTTFDNIFYIFYFIEDIKLVTDFSLTQENVTVILHRLKCSFFTN